MPSWGDASLTLTIAIVVGVVVLAAGIVQCRRGERWLLVTIVMPPAGPLVGWYADDHGWTLLGTAAFALLPLGVVVRIVANRRRGRMTADTSKLTPTATHGSV
jgi:hypothetical protein